MLGRPSNQPDRRLADELLDSGNGQLDVLALLLLAHGVIVDPTPAVADHLVPFLDERARQFGIHLQAAYHAENAGLDIEALEDPQQPPAADPRSILKGGFDHGAALARIRRKTNVGEQVLRLRIAFKDRVFAAGLDVQVQVDRDTRIAGPTHLRRVGAVAEKVARRTEPTPLLPRSLPR